MSASTPRQMPVPDELFEVRAEIKRLQEREAELRTLLIDNAELRTGAGYVAEVKTGTQQRTDLKELKAMHPDLVAEFTFPMTITFVKLLAVTDDGEIVSPRKLKAEAAQ